MGLHLYTQHKINDLFQSCTPMDHEIEERDVAGK